MADPSGKWVTDEGVAVQQGAEHYAGMFEKPDDPWLNPLLWAHVLNEVPQYVLPERAVQGMNQAAIFLQIGLVKEGDVLTDGYIWRGLPEKPGYQLFHAKGEYAWFLVLGDAEFDEAVARGELKHGV